MLEKLRIQSQRLLGPEAESPPPEEKLEWFPSLTLKERILGWAICMALGFLLSLGSSFRLIKLIHGNPRPFATIYSVGNIMSLISTSFLAGPINQLKGMFDAKRRVSSIVYLTFIVLTITFCFLPKVPVRLFIVITCIICQFLALVWYSLSYIPYGRAMALTLLKKCRTCADEPV